MRLAVNKGAGAVSTAKLHVRASGSTKSAVRGSIRQNGALQQFFAALQIKLSATSVIGRGNSAAVVPVTSAPVTATVAGAVGTVAHAWTRTAPDAHAWTIDNPTGPTTTFTTNCDQNESFTATFIDTVTDQAGQVLASPTVTVNNANIYYGGGYIGGQPPAPGTSYP